MLALIAYLFRCEAVIIGLNEHNMFIFNYLDKLSGIYTGDAVINARNRAFVPSFINQGTLLSLSPPNIAVITTLSLLRYLGTLGPVPTIRGAI